MSKLKLPSLVVLTLTEREVEALRLCVGYCDHVARLEQGLATDPAFQKGRIYPPLPDLDREKFPHIGLAWDVLNRCMEDGNDTRA